MGAFVRWIHRFIRELRRRRIIRVAVVYATTAFVILQLAEILVEPFGLGGWSLRLITLVLILGFPLAVGLAWVFNVTEEGLVRTGAEADGEIGPEGKPLTSNAIIIGLLAVAVGLLLYPRVFSSGESAGGQASPTQTDTAKVAERSIAVLPFEPLSSGEESRTFARGVHDDLLTRLANISALKVISRTAVERYRDTDLPTSQIADSLGVRWVVEGGVQVLGDQIQVNAQLIDPRSEAHAWADNYQRALTAEDLFAVQGEITQEIAQALKAQLTAGEQSRVTGAPTENLDAYRLYVQGRALLRQRTPTEMERATEFFEQAIARDSSYALALAGLADALVLREWYGYGVPRAAPDPEEVARRALELNPRLAEAHASLGLLHTYRVEGPEAVRRLERAVELRPSYVQAQGWLCFVYLLVGQPEQAMEPARRAAELNPPPETRSELAEAYLANGNVEKALSEIQKALEESGENPLFHLLEGIALYQLGRFPEAISTLKPRSAQFAPSGHRATVALARLATGDTAQAREQLAGIQDADDAFFWEGLVLAALGQPDEAFDAFDKVRRWSAWPTLPFRYYYPDVLTPLREAPRYEKLLRQVNRAWGLNPDGTIPEDFEVPSPTDPEADA